MFEDNVIGVKKVDDNIFTVLVTGKMGNRIYTTNGTYISPEVGCQMVVGRWYSTIDLIYDNARCIKD